MAQKNTRSVRWCSLSCYDLSSTIPASQAFCPHLICIDKFLASRPSPPSLEGLSLILSLCLRSAAARSRGPVLEIVVTLFKLYFHLDTLQLCQNLVNVIDRMDFDAFPASARVTYKFYLGRLAILNSNYVRPPPPLTTRLSQLQLRLGRFLP